MKSESFKQKANINKHRKAVIEFFVKIIDNFIGTYSKDNICVYNGT